MVIIRFLVPFVINLHEWVFQKAALVVAFQSLPLAPSFQKKHVYKFKRVELFLLLF